MDKKENSVSQGVLGSVILSSNFWLCVIINILNKIGRTCAKQPITLVGSSISMSATMIGSAMSVFFICSMLIRTPFGSLMDRFNKKVVLSAAFGFQALSYVLYLLVDNSGMYVFCKAMEGFGFGMAQLAMAAVVASTGSRKSMGSALGFLSMIPFLASALTNQITLWITSVFGTKYSILGAIICIGCCIILSWVLKFQPATEEKAEKKTDMEKTTGRKKLISMMALPTALIMIAVQIPTLLVDNFMVLYGNSAGITFFASYISIYMASNGISGGAIGYLYDKLGAKLTVFPTIISGIIATIMLATTQSVGPWMVSAVLMGIAGGGITALCRARGAAMASRSEIGLVMGTYALVMDAASIILNPVGGMIADKFGYAALYGSSAVLPILALIASVVFFQKIFGDNKAAEAEAR
jgi:MFS family permease